MGAAICQDGELDFRLIFGEEDSDAASPRSTMHAAVAMLTKGRLLDLNLLPGTLAYVTRTCDHAHHLRGGKCLSLRPHEITNDISQQCSADVTYPRCNTLALTSFVPELDQEVDELYLILESLHKHFSVNESIRHKLPAAEDPESLLSLKTTVSSMISPHTDLESDDPSLCNDVTTDTLTLGSPSSSANGGAGGGVGCITRAGMHSPPPRRASDNDLNGTFISQPCRFIPLGGSRFLECPSIRITSDSPSNSDGEQEESSRNDIWDEKPHRDQLFLPPDPFGYRDSFLSPSPASSHSSWSFLSSEASSCDSLGQMCEEVERELNEAASRFTLASPLGSPRGSPKPWGGHNDEFWPAVPISGAPPSPREELLSPYHSGQVSRPTSPCGKRRYSNSNDEGVRQTSSPSPSHSRRGSLGDENLSTETEASPKPTEHSQQTTSTSLERGDNIPQKARRTSAEQTVAPVRPEESTSPGKTFSTGSSVGVNDESTGMFPQNRKDNVGMDYLAVPSALAWSKARGGGQSPIFRSSSLPPLDWPLHSQFEGLELRIEVQPRTHHRAHYETEGSRGAVKASPGGHPIVKDSGGKPLCDLFMGVNSTRQMLGLYIELCMSKVEELVGYNEKPLTLQMFIGTADERNLRSHAFYQVHRITGKMVATPSYEALVGSTKVLEMSLLPENNMCANIDCAGILKLRNSDIELRKGETDIGRKNTRVRLVFRVHIPQGGGKGVSLQVASIPIECSQRSAQELPQVENYNLSACSVNGREELLLCGSNFLSDSKVIFLEKGPDGKLQWEEEAKVNRLKSNESLLSVQVPEYCNKEITRPLQVYFYISNGRRKRSPMQSFRYLPIIFKEEPLPEIALHRFPSSPLPPPCHIPLDPTHMDLSASFVPPLPPNLPETPMDVSPYYTSPHQEKMFPGTSDCSVGSSSFLGCYFNPPVAPEFKCPIPYQESNSDVSLTLPFQSNTSSPLPPSPVPWSPQPCSSQSSCSTTFSGSLLSHLNSPNKMEERSTGPHQNYSSSPILASLDFETNAHNFVPDYQPYPACAPPTYTTLGESRSLETMQVKLSSTSSEVDRRESCATNQHFTASSISSHPGNPTQSLNSETEDGSVSHSEFSMQASSLGVPKDNNVPQAFSASYQSLTNCTSQLTNLCPSTHPATLSSPSSPLIPNAAIPSQKALSDVSLSMSSNQTEKDTCYQNHSEEYAKSSSNEGRDLGKESQGFESPFHSIPIQGITLEEVSEFIGQDLHRFPEPRQN